MVSIHLSTPDNPDLSEPASPSGIMNWATVEVGAGGWQVGNKTQRCMGFKSVRTPCLVVTTTFTLFNSFATSLYSLAFLA